MSENPTETKPATDTDSTGGAAPAARNAGSKLGARDLVNTGVFTALYFIVLAVVGQLSALTPITQVLGPFFVPLICGIFFVLFATRARHFGQIAAMGILLGVLILVTGQSWYVLVGMLVTATLADWLISSGDRHSFGRIWAGYVVFCIGQIGMVIPLFFQRQHVYDQLIAHGRDQAWINQIMSYTPSWMFYVMILLLMVGATIGAFIGRASLHKHFAKAGIAG
jgi:energy-coupling factor transport system substrate-specific component